jgi:hypothetical protein
VGGHRLHWGAEASRSSPLTRSQSVSTSENVLAALVDGEKSRPLSLSHDEDRDRPDRVEPPPSSAYWVMLNDRGLPLPLPALVESGPPYFPGWMISAVGVNSVPFDAPSERSPAPRPARLGACSSFGRGWTGE